MNEQEKKRWRRCRDSNSGTDFSVTRFPSVLLQPLGHISIVEKRNIFITEPREETTTSAGMTPVFPGKTAREFLNIQNASLPR